MNEIKKFSKHWVMHLKVDILKINISKKYELKKKLNYVGCQKRHKGTKGLKMTVIVMNRHESFQNNGIH